MGTCRGGMRALVLALALLSRPAVAPARNNPERSFMVWMLGNGPDSTAAQWAARIADIKAHAENMTAVSPCIYDIGPDGTFAHGTGPRPYADLYPHMKDLQAMGLEVTPLIAGPPNLAGQRALTSDNGARFIRAAVSEAVANNWSGYNFDNELRGKFTDESWKFLDGYGAPWMRFLNTFADALHAVNKTLSVFICGCCGWVDTEKPLAAIGHCTGDANGNPVGFASHEFVGTSCPDFAASRLDRVYAGSSYGLAINGPDPNPRLNRSTVDALKSITNHSRAALTWERYATGIKGGFPYCANESLPSTCVFDETAKATIDWMGQELGTNHIGYWVNEATSQAEWDAWGYFLQGKSPPPPPPSPKPPLPPPPSPTPPQPYPLQSIEPHGACKIHHTIGCFNDTDWSAGKPGLVLPAYQAAVHGKASLETCAAACHGAKLSVAGVNDGSDCFCGKAADLAKPAVASRGRPKVECMAAACAGDPKEKECGGPGRLLAYHFTCP